MTQKIIYFTAGPVPTTGELAEIAMVTGLEAPYALVVRNGLERNYTGGELEATDYVAGTIPTAYGDDEEYPVYDPENPPDPVLPGDRAIVADGDLITGTGGTFAVTVVDGVIGGVWTAA